MGLRESKAASTRKPSRRDTLNHSLDAGGSVEIEQRICLSEHVVPSTLISELITATDTLKADVL